MKVYGGKAGTILPAAQRVRCELQEIGQLTLEDIFNEEAWEEGIACWQVTVTFAKRPRLHPEGAKWAR